MIYIAWIQGPMEEERMELASAIENAVRRMSEGRRVAVAFSGGLDSGLVACLAKRYAESVTLYTCGSEGSFDVLAAEELSSAIGLPWVHVRISTDNVADMIARFHRATGETDPFTISYELQLFSVCESCQEDVVLTGQGADEYFMGCAKYVECADCDYMAYVKDGVNRLREVSVPCELAIARHFGKELLYPYMDPEVLEVVGKIDPWDMRPKDMDSRKSVLKEAAVELGFPMLAHRTKKSSQYGSGTTDIIRALAKREGMMYNRYIAHICGGGHE